MCQTVAAFTLILALSAFSASASAQTPAGDLASAALKATTLHVALAEKLFFFSRPIAIFRGPLLGVSARDRVTRAHARIRDQLALLGAHLVQLKPDALGLQVHIDGATSFVATPAALDPSRDESLEHAAQQAAAALNLAIRESVEMGVFTTRIRTGLGEKLTISNASILGSATKNHSRTVPGACFVLDTAPQVFQTALIDWYQVYRLVCYTTPTELRPRAVLLSALHANIQDVFNTYGAQIMSPQYLADPREAKIVPPDMWYTVSALKPDV